MSRFNSASDNSFQLVFPKLPHENELDREFILHIFQTTMPGVSFDKQELGWQGFSLPAIFSKLDFEEWNLNFNVDETLDNWKRLFKWMSFINNNRNIAGKKIEEYVIDANLIVYDNYENLVAKLMFANVFPISLSSANFSTREGKDYLTSQITFGYTYFDIDE